jgi:hypothetical protein
MFGVDHKSPKYYCPPAPPPGWSGGTLDKPWTCPGTIEPPQTPVFDQPSLFRPLSCDISAAERFRCGPDLRSAGAQSLRPGGPCLAKPCLWLALPRPSSFIIQPSAFPPRWRQLRQERHGDEHCKPRPSHAFNTCCMATSMADPARSWADAGDRGTTLSRVAS